MSPQLLLLPPIPPSFTAKKATILASLALPTSTYTDLSPKGSVDAAIIPLVERLNRLDGVVTTSSCAGRVSVYLEGRKRKRKSGGGGGGDKGGNKDDGGGGLSWGEEKEKEKEKGGGDGGGEEEEEGGEGEEGKEEGKDEDKEEEEEEEGRAGGVGRGGPSPGGKGYGGRWLFVSHAPVDVGAVAAAAGGLLSEVLGLATTGSSGQRQRQRGGGRHGSSVGGLGMRLVRFQFEPMVGFSSYSPDTYLLHIHDGRQPDPVSLVFFFPPSVLFCADDRPCIGRFSIS